MEVVTDVLGTIYWVGYGATLHYLWQTEKEAYADQSLCYRALSAACTAVFWPGLALWYLLTKT